MSFLQSYDSSLNSVNTEMSIVDNILNEYEHVCVNEEYAERAKCVYCLENANSRNVSGASRRYCNRFSIHDCMCHVQPVAVSHKCRICCEIEDDIRFIGEEIMRGYLTYAQEVVHSFRTNPDTERRISEMAFRREMLHEFIIHQKIKMERRQTRPEECDDLFSYVSSSDSGYSISEPDLGLEPEAEPESKKDVEKHDDEASSDIDPRVSIGTNEYPLYLPEYDIVPYLNDGGPMRLSDLDVHLSLVHPDDLLQTPTNTPITHHIPTAPMKIRAEPTSPVSPLDDKYEYNDPMDISYTP